MGGTRVRRKWFVPSALLAASTAVFAAGGDLDATFGSGGVITLSVSSGAFTTDFVVQDDDKVVIGGEDAAGWSIRRVSEDGSVDTTFGIGGSVSLFGTSTTRHLWDLRLDEADRVLAVGNAVTTYTTGTGKKAKTTSVNAIALVRLTPSGALDVTFGGDGIVSTVVPNALAAEGRAVAVHTDGKIVVGGHAVFASGRWSSQFAHVLVRYHPDGAIDTSFGTGGIRVDDLTSGDDRIYGGGLAIQSDGKPLLAGSAGTTGWAITRYNANGTLDTGFASIRTAGWFVRGLGVDGSGRIVAVGDVTYGTNSSDMLVARYLTGGTSDVTFGSGGSAVVHSTNRSAALDGPAFQADGKIVFTGAVYPNAPTTFETDAVSVRLTQDGALDASYGSGGMTAPLALNPTENSATGLGLVSDGRLVIGGNARGSGSFEWFLARYLAD